MRQRTRSGRLSLLVLAALAVASFALPAVALAAPPTVTIDPGPTASYTSAHVTGAINPNASASPISYYFEYSRDPGSEGWTNFIFAGEISATEAEGTNPIAVEGNLGGLQPGAEYQVRLTAVYEGTEFSSPGTPFTTEPVTPPVVTVEDASAVNGTSAHFAGTVTAGNADEAFDSECRFEYITDAAFQPLDEVQKLTVNAEGGTYTVSFEGEETAPIAFDASAAQLDSALETLASVGAAAVNVSGGPGNGSGSNPYSVAFTGPLAAVNVPELSTDPTALTGSAKTANVVTTIAGHAEGFEGAQSVPCQPNPVTGAGSTPVQANPIELFPHTTYHLRLRAENLGGFDIADAATFTTLAIAPKVTRTFVTGIGTAQATLNASINPGGAATTYHFEYVTEAQFKVSEFAAAASTPESSSIGEDNAEHAASAAISGLQPDTAYRYRVIATNSVTTVAGKVRGLHTAAAAVEPEADSCPNAAFRTGPSANLPDCRAYEMVSPVDKNGADLIPSVVRTRVSLDGDRALFASLAGFGDVHGIGVSNEYLSLRDAATGTWRTHAVSAPQDITGYFGAPQGLEPLFLALSSDLSQGVLSTRTPLTAAPNVSRAVNLYRRDDLLSPGKGAYQLLTDSTTLQPPSLYSGLDPSFGFWKPAVADTSADFSQVLFESRRNLGADTVACTESNPDANCPPLLYKFSAGVQSFVGWVPATPGDADCTGEAPSCAIPAAGAQAGRGAMEPNATITEGTLSADGSRAIFTVPTDPSASDGALYIRDDHGTHAVTDDTTTQLNVSEKASLGSAKPATFWAASSGIGADDERVPLKVFFTTSEQLTEDDTNESDDAYMWSEQADGVGDHLTRLSVDSEPADGVAPRVDGIIGASEDGRYAYFITSANQLVAGNPSGTTGGDGDKRIFVSHEGALREVGAIGVLESERSLSTGAAEDKISRLSPDGTHIAFTTQGSDELLSLYGDPEPDHGTACPGDSDPRCSEVYLYDATANAGAGGLHCVSCGPSGAPAVADAFFFGSGEGLGVSAPTSYQNNPLSDDGRFLFFNTAQPLLEADTNGTVDAYEYDAETDSVHLISSGTSSSVSLFMDVSADGASVLLLTRERLRTSDNDQSRDLYVARIGGGSIDPPVPPACQPDSGSCQEQGVAPPGAATPQSNRPSGLGNVREKRCAKSKRRVIRNGKVRCVKKKTKRDQRKNRANVNQRASR